MQHGGGSHATELPDTSGSTSTPCFSSQTTASLLPLLLFHTWFRALENRILNLSSTYFVTDSEAALTSICGPLGSELGASRNHQVLREQAHLSPPLLLVSLAVTAPNMRGSRSFSQVNMRCAHETGHEPQARSDEAGAGPGLLVLTGEKCRVQC